MQTTRMLTAAALGVLLGLALSAKPWQELERRRAEEREAVAKTRAAEERMVDAARRLAEVQSSTGRERLARERGYIRPDETPIEP